MNKLYALGRRSVFAGVASLLGLAVVLPALLVTHSVSAAQVTSRSITMSTSVASVAASYTLAFTPVISGGSLIIDFCSNDPIYNDTCSFSAATVPTVAASLTTSAGTGTGVGSGTPKHTVQITGLTMTGGTPFSVTISAGITNPTSVGTFFARILTYTGTNSSTYAPATTTGGAVTPGSFQDYGGDALSTTNSINITAKVFETLSFCVFMSGSCATAPVLTLGDALTGALSPSTAYVSKDAQYTLSTNAGSGVVVTMKGTTLCRSTTPATDCVPGAGNYNTDTITSMGGSAIASLVGSEQFGMCVHTSATALLAHTPYNGTCTDVTTDGTYAGSSNFAFNDATAAGGTNNASGSTVLQSTGAVSSADGQGNFAFIANDAATTEAGIYTASLNLVATSTY